MFDTIIKHLKNLASDASVAYTEGRYGFGAAEQRALVELGLSPESSFAEVKRRYYEYCRRFHPDRCCETEAHERFLRIKAAYDVLKSAYEKRETDE